MKKWILFLMVLISIISLVLLSGVICYASNNAGVIDDDFGRQIKALEQQNEELKKINVELNEFKKNYDKDEVIQYYKEMQSDYQNTFSVIFTVFSILITIGVVVVPVYSKIQEAKELEKINKLLSETKEDIHLSLEETRNLKIDLDNRLEIHRIILDVKLLENSGKYYEAISIVEGALDKNEQKEYYELLAYLYELDKNHEKSIQTLKKAISSKQYDQTMVYKLADKLLGQKDYSGALEYFTKSIQENHADYKGYYSIGKTYECIEDVDNAIGYYKKTIDLNPSLVAAHLRLARLYVLLNDDYEAIRILKIANHLIPNNFKILDMEVDLMTKNHLTDEAKSILEAFEGDEIKIQNLSKYFSR